MIVRGRGPIRVQPTNSNVNNAWANEAHTQKGRHTIFEKLSLAEVKSGIYKQGGGNPKKDEERKRKKKEWG